MQLRKKVIWIFNTITLSTTALPIASCCCYDSAHSRFPHAPRPWTEKSYAKAGAPDGHISYGPVPASQLNKLNPCSRWAAPGSRSF